jgi:hypothetical protein
MCSEWQAYETISFASFKWTPPPPVKHNQQWKHLEDGSLSPDGLHCLDWAARDGSVYVSPCDAAGYPHQVVKL